MPAFAALLFSTVFVTVQVPIYRAQQPGFIDVEMRFSQTSTPTEPNYLFAFPQTAVGLYMSSIPFGANIEQLRAFDVNGANMTVSLQSPGVFLISGSTTSSSSSNLGSVKYLVNTAQNSTLSPLVSVHLDPAHVMLSGYQLFAQLHIASNGFAYKSNYEVEVVFEDPAMAKTCFVALPMNATAAGCTYVANSFFQLVDSPLFAGKDLSTRRFPASGSVPAQTLLVSSSESHLDKTIDVTLLTHAQQIAIAAIESFDLPQQVLSDVGAHYAVMFELFPPNPNLGWALEHGGCFQAVDQNGIGFSDTLAQLAFHLTHHEGHSFWAPRNLYIASSLAPLSQLAQQQSSFIFFAEGFDQYLAFVGLARTKQIPLTTVLLALARRFATPYLKHAPPGPTPSMASMSIRQYTDQTYWFYHFSSGALLALLIDSMFCAVGSGFTGYSLAEAMRDLLVWNLKNPAGVPENAFADVFTAVTGLNVTTPFETHVWRSGNPLNVSYILGTVGVEITGDDSYLVLSDSALSPSALNLRRTAFRASVP
eukprot:comp20325_c0_seq2/m.40568 comp20325_c0_seq2/g.40568  ORF comp20325_c0_seq2/g.40568 comp20325_c0_seq2/m.40568 type:complete len:535 (-) comp20325_c0_seq2:48-1652(-)